MQKSKILTIFRFAFFIVIFHFAFLIFNSNSATALLIECSGSNIPYHKLDGCISEIENEVNQLKPAHERNQQELADLKKQIANIKTQIKNLTFQVNGLEQDIISREEDLILQEELLKERVRSFYITSRQYSPIIVFLSSRSAKRLTQELVLRGQVADDDRQIIERLSAELLELRQDKQTLEISRAGLTRIQVQVDNRASFLEGEVSKVESYINSLTAKQQDLLAQKAGGFQTSVGDTPPTLEPCSGPPGSENYCDPGFTAFGVFSFGAPHRTGMSQYGALGRSKQGQSAEDILRAYYQGAELNKSYAIPDTIGVNGYGRIPFEDNYLLGIYEVPEKWGNEGGFEALKAQAVAARSFALAATNNGSGNICTTEACQVYKPQLKSGKWAEAVKATRGWVMTKGGQAAKTYYSSTTGGYTISQWGWNGIKDTTGRWPDTAYEKIAGSPWFYKGWYKTRSGKSCGRSNPWLTPKEMADIINAWHVLYKGGGDSSRVSPLGNCWQGNPYSQDDLKNIGGYSSVSSASVVYGNNGSTIEVAFSTNKGTVTIPGGEFKKAFNLRAPGYIGVKSSLFNVVKTN